MAIKVTADNVIQITPALCWKPTKRTNRAADCVYLRSGSTKSNQKSALHTRLLRYCCSLLPCIPPRESHGDRGLEAVVCGLHQGWCIPERDTRRHSPPTPAFYINPTLYFSVGASPHLLVLASTLREFLYSSLARDERHYLKRWAPWLARSANRSISGGTRRAVCVTPEGWFCLH